MSTPLDPVSIAADLLCTVKSEGSPAEPCDRLAALDRDRLSRGLARRPVKLSFWFNCYNAYAQLLLDADPGGLGRGLVERWKFVTRDRIPVAGAWSSLADLEHGMLRGSKHPWGLGYLPRPFPSPFEREFRLEECDPRVHFALGCGDDRDPPVTGYSPEAVDEELDVAVEWYVEENVTYHESDDVVRVPRLFRRYRGDFDGSRGTRSFLRRYDGIPPDSEPSIEYVDAGRSIDLDQFRP